MKEIKYRIIAFPKKEMQIREATVSFSSYLLSLPYSSLANSCNSSDTEIDIQKRHPFL
ncbi:hypothetical protein Bmyc01_21870 [Bacillus mycoides]|nr:hypothetical protein Bmyc01_21870 [Bacillus mycoides]